MRYPILQLFKRTIAYHPEAGIAFKSVKLGLLWSQILYWSDKTNDPDKWIYKTQIDLFYETGLTRKEQETARRLGEELGVLESKVMGTPPTVHYKFNEERSEEVLQNYFAESKNGKLFNTENKPKVKKGETPGEIARKFFEEKSNTIRIELLDIYKITDLHTEQINDELDSFVSYWTEPTKSGRKQKWETQATFDVKRRLKKWFDNKKKWSKNDVKNKSKSRSI